MRISKSILKRFILSFWSVIPHNGHHPNAKIEYRLAVNENKMLEIDDLRDAISVTLSLASDKVAMHCSWMQEFNKNNLHYGYS